MAHDNSGISEMKKHKYHLVGIGGAGMSAIARILKWAGCEVQGSDIKESRNISTMIEEGIPVQIGHRRENVLDADVVVYSSAIDMNNPEIEEAASRGLIVMKRAEVLWNAVEDMKTVVVSGTHGKTTTTSMIAFVMEKLGLDPTYVIGGELNDIGSNARLGKGKYAVIEADESDRSFLMYRPDISVITNIDDDHLENYEGFEGLKRGFKEFLLNSSNNAQCVICADDGPCADVRKMLESERSDISFFEYGESALEGIKILDYFESPESLSGVLLDNRSGKMDIELAIPGKHNLLNAAACIGVLSCLGENAREAASLLSGFTGVKRRFDFTGSFAGIDFYDDYAHHPSEIARTLEAARIRAGNRRLIAVFQPHRYSRTMSLGRRTGESLAGADISFVLEVYAAGETPIPGVSGKVVADALSSIDEKKLGGYIMKRASAAQAICSALEEGDFVITMGAGDISSCGREVLSILEGSD